jgi:phage tail sheath protein FI
MARTDQSVGVWKAPAGLKADFQGGIFDVETILSDPENGILNKEAINCLRLFPSGLVCWGARNMIGTDDSTETDYRYVPARRLALFIEESLYRGTKFAVFEPNDEPLWAQLRASVTGFMRRLFRAQALQGRTEDEAFFVKCDSETTTADDQNLGIVNILVGFAALKPAEFIIITIQQLAREV